MSHPGRCQFAADVARKQFVLPTRGDAISDDQSHAYQDQEGAGDQEQRPVTIVGLAVPHRCASLLPVLMLAVGVAWNEAANEQHQAHDKENDPYVKGGYAAHHLAMAVRRRTLVRTV